MSETNVEKKREVCSWCERFTDNHFYGYYISFDPTGVEEIDRILCSIAAAGKGYHHTEGWGEGGYLDLIQRAAQAAADKVKSLATPPLAPCEPSAEPPTLKECDDAYWKARDGAEGQSTEPWLAGLAAVRALFVKEKLT